MGWLKIFFHPCRSFREIERLVTENESLCSDIVSVEERMSQAIEKIRSLEDELAAIRQEYDNLRVKFLDQKEIESNLQAIEEIISQGENMKKRYRQRIMSLRHRLNEEISMNADIKLSLSRRHHDEISIDEAPDYSLPFKHTKTDTLSQAEKPQETSATVQMSLPFEDKGNSEKDTEPLDLLSPLPEDSL